MKEILIFGIGMILGYSAGFATLLAVVAFAPRNKQQLTKEEWKMGMRQDDWWW